MVEKAWSSKRAYSVCDTGRDNFSMPRFAHYSEIEVIIFSSESFCEGRNKANKQCGK